MAGIGQISDIGLVANDNSIGGIQPRALAWMPLLPYMEGIDCYYAVSPVT